MLPGDNYNNFLEHFFGTHAQPASTSGLGFGPLQFYSTRAAVPLWRTSNFMGSWMFQQLPVLEPSQLKKCYWWYCITQRERSSARPTVKGLLVESIEIQLLLEIGWIEGHFWRGSNVGPRSNQKIIIITDHGLAWIAEEKEPRGNWNRTDRKWV